MTIGPFEHGGLDLCSGPWVRAGKLSSRAVPAQNDSQAIAPSDAMLPILFPNIAVSRQDRR